MPINSKQLRDLIVDPTIRSLGLYSEVASDLIMGTCAQESRLGTYLKQMDDGVALGICQMEPNTYMDIFDNYLNYRTTLKRNLFKCIDWYMDFEPPSTMLIYNLRFSVAMCRIHYYRVKEELPTYGDIGSLGMYWKQHYNTMHGKGTVAEFVNSYRLMVDRGL